jgi:hypothetical protein
MIRKLFPALLALLGLGAGLGAGLMLRPEPEAGDHAGADPAAHAAGAEHGGEAAQGDGHEGGTGPEYVKLNNQFVIPVVDGGRVVSLVVLSLSIEIEAGATESVYDHEPKLRDVFLQVMFDHANVGGFSGSFTDGSNLLVLRTSLKEAAALVLGTTVRDVLITDIARQDS